jgi:hypothetical protein
MRVAPSLFVLLSLSACGTSAVLPPGTEVPALDGPRLTQVQESDGVGERVWLTHGFSGGEPVAYWDFGVVTNDAAMPVYVLCRPSGSSCAPIEGHPRIAPALPGDDGYSPFGWVHEVAVTDAFAGEVIASVAAIDDAVSAGLVSEPEPTLFFLELAIVDAATSIELGPDDWAGPNATLYVDGVAVSAVDFSLTHPRLRLDDPSAGTVLVRNVYILTRDGESAPLNERMRDEDLTGDGDLSDANSILGARLDEPDYTPLWAMVLVTVPSDYASIDTSSDQNVADAMSATDLFTIAPDYSIVPIEGRVVDFSFPGPRVNCPIQSAPGAL